MKVAPKRRQRPRKPACYLGRCKARHDRDDGCKLPPCPKCGALVRGFYVHRLGQPACPGPCQALLLCGHARSSSPGDVRCARARAHGGMHVSHSGLYRW